MLHQNLEKRRNNVFNDVIQKSKRFKGQKRKEKMEFSDLREELDNDFNEISSLLKIGNVKTKDEEYEKVIQELMGCDKVEAEKNKKPLSKVLKMKKETREGENFVIDDSYLKQEEEEEEGEGNFENGLLTVDENQLSDEDELNGSLVNNNSEIQEEEEEGYEPEGDEENNEIEEKEFENFNDSISRIEEELETSQISENQNDTSQLSEEQNKSQISEINEKSIEKKKKN